MTEEEKSIEAGQRFVAALAFAPWGLVATMAMTWALLPFALLGRPTGGGTDRANPR